MQTQQIVASGLAALLFAATFLGGDRVHPFHSLIRDRRTVISIGAGIAIAYVFVHAMPELSDARRVFAASVSRPLRYEGMAIYFFSLVGFLVFYGLDHLRKRLRRAGDPGRAGTAFKIQVGGFAVYVWQMAYLLVHNLEDTSTSIGLFALSISVHFLGVDNALREEHGEAYVRIGRYVLAAAALFGWGVGLLVPLPQMAVAMLVAFVSGAVIMNSSIMELPTESDGQFLPFMWGGLIYGLILMPFG